MLTHAAWVGVPGLRHGFLDRADCTAATWGEAVASVGVPLPIAVPRQVHGTRVVSAEPHMEPPQADGLVTARTGLLVGVLTADCAPVLLVDRRRCVAAAVHAGWRGTAAGVLEATVAHLGAAFGTPPADLEAVIGPAIAGCCYHVGPDVREAFRARTGSTTAPAWSTRDGRLHLDLRVAARLLLQAMRVTTPEVAGPCTACAPGYHSYRRDGARTGRQLSFVGWA